MSWAETLLDASFRGVPIQVVEESVQWQRSLAEHGTPFKDGDSVRDLGRGARRFPMQLVVFGVNYEIELQNIIRALEIIGPGELIHPIYGSLSVVSQNVEIKHVADAPDAAVVSLVFVEDTPDLPFFARQFEFVDIGVLEPEDQYRWQDGIFDLFGRIDSLVAEIQSWIGGGWVGLIEKALGLPGIFLRVQQLRSQILGVVSGVASMAKHPSAAFDPLSDLFRTPAQIRSSVQGSTPSSSLALLSRSGIPAAMPGGDGLTTDAARVGNGFLISAREGVAPDAGLLPNRMPDDPVEASAFSLVVLVVTELAVAHAQAVAILIEAEAKKPTLSPVEVEGLVNLVRSLVQGSILLQRRLFSVEDSRPVIEALRNTAAMIQARGRQVILQSPPMIERVVQTPASLRLLAHRWYGDHARSVELIRLNPDLKNPHNIPAGKVLRAYAE
ncbi:Mu-like prophage DNA circulation protein [Pseudomonas sp. NFPP10]|uniref:DNA circularization protein n=1 Tax=unclassified Pseudomonas TaxID=196821 RepID=UPI0008846283|nr:MULTISPECIES: DNA circularization N-terminal domain-containing protein [unclassified Pseudomonas]SDA18124.1 Mu-like prophage DNA circulation protein [Pseudomonas sp. NFPP12]SEK98575.1 Mu-like prophage DNA circulation protein [Pseudomonas sp. NFPP10]SFI57319.1 Mu-like prophage DNA circulation protein [Pseudomonas sp. NFPP08]SFM42679.1 Mu-like prophage DNA circulation protein [Pseudomonas sp. NFPP05]SFX31124.1 Mu-like prophage DNA circulation protein [Pseudomonas sp. NFPP09]